MSDPMVLEASDWSRVYDVLVEDCGAREGNDRGEFVLSMLRGTCEYRFKGLLGPGGKLWNNGGQIYVTCYAEDRNVERSSSIHKANSALRDLVSRIEASRQEQVEKIADAVKPQGLTADGLDRKLAAEQRAEWLDAHRAVTAFGHLSDESASDELLMEVLRSVPQLVSEVERLERERDAALQARDAASKAHPDHPLANHHVACSRGGPPWACSTCAKLWRQTFAGLDDRER